MILGYKLFWAAVLSVGALAAQSASIEFDGTTFRIDGWRANGEPASGWSSLFSVRVDAADAPQMLGTYSAANELLQFRPRFPLADGVSYRAEALLPDGQKLTKTVDRPRHEIASTTRVENIYPSTNILPSNILKLYIQFSKPMSRGEAWQRIHLLDEAGKPVPLAFLEIDQELWDSAGRRLTVLFDPGRIKRGLVPTNEMGSAITEGRDYRLVIDKDWRDSQGVPLESGFEKLFKGGPSERKSPSPDRWTLKSPHAGTMEPLTIQFPVPMDIALLSRMIQVEGIEGTGSIIDEERTWKFVPLMPWKTGTFRIVADNLLEDISGNHLDRPFDVDLSSSPRRNLASSGTSILRFQIQ